MTPSLVQASSFERQFVLRLWIWLVVIPLCYWAALAAHPGVLLAVGVHHVGGWFLDLYAILASNDALSRGLDVYAPNPLDPFARPHIYSHWWFVLGKLGFTRANNFTLGLTLSLAFFTGAVAALRPRTRGELFWYLALLVSSPVLLAVERANNDLVIFLVLAGVVPCLLSPRAGWQVVAGLLIAFAAGLKFYPAVAALLLFAPGDAHCRRWRWGCGGLALALVFLDVVPDFVRVRMLLPRAEGLMTFGAVNLFTEFGLGSGRAQIASLLVGGLAAGIWLRVNVFAGWKIPASGQNAWLHFVLGAWLLTGCFFSGTSYAYRWVFALWLAPWLWRLWHDETAPTAVRRLARVTAGLLVAALWIDPMTGMTLVNLSGHVPPAVIGRVAEGVFALEQPVTWALFVCLIGFLMQFVRDGWGAIRTGR